MRLLYFSRRKRQTRGLSKNIMENLEKRIIEEIQEQLKGTEYEAEYQTTTKNNGVSLNGVRIRKEDTNIAPVVYFQDYIEKVEDNALSVSEAAEAMISLAMSANPDFGDVNEITKWEYAKDKLLIVLVSGSGNAELLKTCPHKYFCGDLVIVYRIYLHSDPMGMATVLVTNDILKTLGKTEEELFEAAKESSLRIAPVMSKGICQLLSEMMPGFQMGLMFGDAPDNDPLTVISNENKVFGASAIVYSDILAKIAEENDSDLYIIPSSTHEVIVFPPTGDMTITQLCEMINEVNTSQVPEQDILSDVLYKYDRATGRVCVAEEAGKETGPIRDVETGKEGVVA